MLQRKQSLTGKIGIVAILLLSVLVGAFVAPGVVGAQTSPLTSPIPTPMTLEDCYAGCEPGAYEWRCRKSCRCYAGVDTRCSLDDYEQERPCPPPHAKPMPELWMGQFTLWQWQGVHGSKTYYCVEGW